MARAVIGRDEELASIEAFLARAASAPAALLVGGEPGIGKTVLWHAGVRRAGERGARVLSCRGLDTEATFAFTGLSDLLGGLVDDALRELRPPRRRALEVALLLAEPGARDPDPRAVGLAVLDALRALAGAGPVVVAIDDLQWLDRSSAGVLTFAVRRLVGEPVGLFATVRLARGARLPFDLERALPEGMAQRMSLDPLGVGACHALLKDRLALELARPEIVHLHDVTRGNAFYLLELGRELARTTTPRVAGGPLPVPRSLSELLGARLARLPERSRTVLLGAAALGRPSVEVLSAAYGDADAVGRALEQAARAGIVELEGSRVRFAHPMLASVCYEDAPVWRRRTAHRLLASAVADEEERARHLALASVRPDAGVAAALDAAAGQAARRGATAAAAELCELAAGLTPDDDHDRARRRRLRAADFHRLAGDRDRAAALLEDLLRAARPGAERADVLFALARGRRADLPAIAAMCGDALAEAAHDPARRAEILAFLSWIRLLEGRVRDGLAHARAAWESAEHVGDHRLVARAIARLAMAETWTLDVTGGLLERGVAIEETLDRPLEFHESPSVTLARRLMCLSEFDAARPILERAEATAAAGGDEGTRGHVLFHLFQLEWFTGRWDVAARHAAATRELAEQLHDQQHRGIALYAQALLDAHLGRVDEARAGALEAVAVSEALSDALFGVQSRTVLGFLELSLGDFAAADRHLRPLPGWLVSRGWDEPTDFAWANAIEALIGLEELDEARSVLADYEDRARRSRSAWALATAGRCRGLLEAAGGDLAAAFAAFDDAVAQHARTRAPFEHGRTLLALGSVRRRAKQKSPAREALDESLAIFDAVGARLWADRTRAELRRIAGRRPASSSLTETELRVAALAAEGRSNKEIAVSLYMSVHTVEAHLSRVYRKLGLRSRAGLARRLAASSADAAPRA